MNDLYDKYLEVDNSSTSSSIKYLHDKIITPLLDGILGDDFDEELLLTGLEEYDKYFEDLDTSENYRKLKKTSISKKNYAKKYYRKNRLRIKKKMKKFRNSVEGKKRERLKKLKLKSGRTSTGRKKRSYNK